MTNTNSDKKSPNVFDGQITTKDRNVEVKCQRKLKLGDVDDYLFAVVVVRVVVAPVVVGVVAIVVVRVVTVVAPMFGFSSVHLRRLHLGVGHVRRHVRGGRDLLGFRQGGGGGHGTQHDQKGENL